MVCVPGILVCLPAIDQRLLLLEYIEDNLIAWKPTSLVCDRPWQLTSSIVFPRYTTLYITLQPSAQQQYNSDRSKFLITKLWIYLE